MRVLNVASINYLKTLPPIDNNQSYHEQLETYRTQHFLSPNSFTPNLRRLGWECTDFLIDHIPLAQLYCCEHGLTFENTHQTLKEFIRLYRPEVLFLQRDAVRQVSPAERRMLKIAFPFLKKIVAYWGAQLSSEKELAYFRELDYLFCLDNHLKQQMCRVHSTPYITPPAFDPIDLPESDKEHDVVFLGSSGYGFSDHQQRYDILKYLLEHTPVKMWLSEPMDEFHLLRIKFGIYQIMQHVPFLHKVEQWHNVFRNTIAYREGRLERPNYLGQGPLRRKYPRNTYPPVFGHEYCAIIKCAKVVFNCHVDQEGHGGNMRTFEVTGLGSCLLTDREEQIKHLFVPDKEMVCYSSVEEAVDKMRYLLDHPEEREAIAKRGYERTMRDHTTFHRVQKMVEIISGGA